MLNWLKKIFKPEPEMLTAPKNERYYQLKCNEIFQGKVEYKLSDGTRVDILTDDLAIEVDFARKWYEAIGQACHYSRLSNRKPGVLLIVKSPSEEKYAKATLEVCKVTQVNGYHIAVFVYRDY